LLTIGCLLLGCTSSTEPAPETALGDAAITVGSFNFAESEVVAEIYSQALESEGFAVERKFGLGPRELVAPALAQGLIEVVPEYAGTALQFVSLGEGTATADTRTTHDELVDALERAGNGVIALAPAPAEDANSFVVTQATADEHHIRALSDLAARSDSLTFGGPPECASRPLCLAGLEQVYGIRFGNVLRLDTGGPLTRQALLGDYVDVALLLSTDPAIEVGHLVELIDDRNLQPAENVTPLVRREVIDRFGSGVADRLNAVSARLSTFDLRSLNAELANQGATLHDVAARWLRAERLT
jgi:osmoprotectant transport system substrate-binding protein